MLTAGKYHGVEQRDNEQGSSITTRFIVPPSDRQAVKINCDPQECTKSSTLSLPVVVFGFSILCLLLAIVIELSISNALLENDDQSSEMSCTSGFESSSLISVEDDAETTGPFQLYRHPSMQNQLFMLINSSFVLQSIPFLFIEQLVQGVGDRKLFWDAGNIITQDLVHFRLGDHRKILLQALPTHYRSQSDLIDRSFAISTVWTADILSQTHSGFWVNVTDLGTFSAGFIHSNGLASVISSTYGSQYQYHVNTDASFIDTARSRANSLRTYWTSNLTYELSSPTAPSNLESMLGTGKWISIAVRRTMLTLASHVNDGRANASASFPFLPRLFHPKCGFNYISYMNEDASLLAVRNQQYIVRHRLKDPGGGGLHPIVYYIDRIVPEDIRNALIDGVSWWDEAFSYAGYPKNTFVAKVAPEDFDPYEFYDERIHYVEWIDRDLRYYSVGLRVVDPRSGEIIKGHVRVEGLRMRQDAILLSSLLSPYTQPDGSIDPVMEQQMNAAILQRVRQLGAHEVGHTLGLSHNFAGSTHALGAASVMDYPPPLVVLQGDQLVVGNQSYSNGIGFFDKVAIAYGYKDLGVAPLTRVDQERDALYQLLTDAEAEGYVYVTDQDSALGGSDWRGTKWDLGSDAVNALNTSMVVRGKALSTLAEQAIGKGSAMSRLLEVFPNVYMWHRYAFESAAKLVGGRSVVYDVRGDGSKTMVSRPVDAALQRKAIAQLLTALAPSQFSVSLHFLSLSSSASFGFEPEVGGIEDLFSSRLGVYGLDPVVLVESLAAVLLSTALEPSRIERVFIQNQLNASLPSLAEFLRAFTDYIFVRNATAGQPVGLLSLSTPWEAAHIQNVYVNSLLGLQSSYGQTSELVNSEVQRALAYIAQMLAATTASAECAVGDANTVYDVSATCIRLQTLQSNIGSKKQFLKLLPVPEGPPI